MTLTYINSYTKKKSIKIKRLSISKSDSSYLDFCTLNNSFIFPKLWTAITKDFYYFKDFDQFYSLKKKYSEIILKEETIKKKSNSLKENKGLYFLLGCDDNYYHNLINFLPKLAVMSTMQKEIINIIINNDLSSNVEDFITNHLKLIKIKNYKFFKIKWDSKIQKFEKLIFVSKPSIGFAVNFYYAFYKKFYVNQRKYNFYFIRGAVKNRKVLNEKKLINYFNSIDFKVIDCSKLSILEQINIFSSSKNVIIVSGAAMANMIFAPPNTNFVEIRSNLDGGYSKEIQQYKKYNLFEFNDTKKIGLSLRKDIIVNITQLDSFLENLNLS
jgi:capsular polysaccharide biosynthesis protein